MRGTTWKDALGEFIPAFLAVFLPTLFAFATGVFNGVVDAIEAGKTPDLQFGLWFETILSLAIAAFGATIKVVLYRFTTARGVQK